LRKGKVKRGQIWMVDYQPQTFKEEPGKRGRPSLIMQTDLLNDAGHPTTMVIPGTIDVEPDAYPLRVPLGLIQKPGEQPQETDLLIDQIRAISNDRILGDRPLTTASLNHMQRVGSALRILLSL
jgi:mRNA interferase MazF